MELVAKLKLKSLNEKNRLVIYVVYLAVENHIDLPLSRVKMNTSDDDKRQGFSQICYIRSSSNPARMLFARD